MKIKAAIIGATGYTGSELVRILLQHPETEICHITSESKTGIPFSEVHPQFEGICDLKLQSADSMDDANIDVAFLALPHRVSMEYVKRWQNHRFKIIDLSGDYRLSSALVYKEWYQKEHLTPDLVPQVPYGLPELNRAQLKSAKIIANPGCYPTASALALAPLLANGLVQTDTLIIDAKSGLTGAGVKSSPTTHFSNVQDNFKAYGLKTHRHTVEIEETLYAVCNQESSKSNKTPVIIQFTPHLLPVDRGILATCYATPVQTVSEQELNKLYKDFYKDEPFVRVRTSPPQIKHVRGTNLCDVYVTYDKRTNRILVLSAIDNLVKGAAGQAVQNMNILFGLKEDTGLKMSPVFP